MKGKPEISVIVNVYKQGSFFRMCLDNLKNQKHRNFEVIIADDGSGQGVERIANSFRKTLKIIHVWQEDKGFRKALVVNKAVKVSSGQKLFFIDGDIVIHPAALEIISRRLKKGLYLTSRVVRLSSKASDFITKNFPARKTFSFLNNVYFLFDWLFGKTRFFEFGIYLPALLASVAQKFKKHRQVAGGLTAITRMDFEKVNGFDNSYIGYGHEDFDIGWRMHWSGVESHVATNQIIAYHLWHKKRKENIENMVKKMAAKEKKLMRCEIGLAQILPESIVIKNEQG